MMYDLKWILMELDGLADTLGTDVRTAEIDDELWHLHRPMGELPDGTFELLTEKTPGAIAFVHFKLARSSFMELLPHTLILRQTRAVRRLQEVLILAGEGFRPRGWDAWLQFREWDPDWPDPVESSFIKWLKWDDEKTVERVEKVFAEAKPFIPEMRRLRARLIVSSLMRGERKSPVSNVAADESRNGDNDEPRETGKPYLGVHLDSSTRTVRREGFDAPPVKLTDKQWQMMLALVHAAGNTAILSDDNYDGSRGRHAMNVIRLSLDDRLSRLGLTTTGYQLQSVRQN